MERIRFFVFISFWFVYAAAVQAQGSPRFDHVLFVLLENTNYSDALKQPFLSKLAAQGARLDNFQAETHPSQGNYVGLTSGDVNGVVGDSLYNVDVRHIGDLLDAKNLTWKVYAENFPGHCFQGETHGPYARRHNPFISYINLQKDPERCGHIVDADQMDADIASGQVPNYALYVPDVNNDGHDTGVAFADHWLEKKVTPLLQNSKFMERMLLAVTFDESSDDVGTPNHILTVLIGEAVKPGSRSVIIWITTVCFAWWKTTGTSARSAKRTHQRR